MNRPVPPSAFRSKAPETAEDFRQVRRYLEQLMLWVDEQVDAVESSAPGTITSVVSGTGITVTGGTGPAATVALSAGTQTTLAGAVQTTRTITAGTGLTGGGDLSANRSFAADFGTASGTVCQGNDSRLPSSGEKSALAGTSGTPGSGNKYVTDADSRNTDSRAPNGSASGDLGGTYPSPTVTAIHETSGPTKLTFGAIPDGTLPIRSGSSVIGASFMYLKPPASPNAFDVEFATSTADLATLGFTFRRVTATAGPMVRVGDIQPFRTHGGYTPLGNLEYRSSVVGGRLCLQLPLNNSVDYTLTKSVSLPTTTTTYGGYLWARAMVGVTATGAGGNGSHYLKMLACKDSGGNADINNCLAMQFRVANTGSSTQTVRDVFHVISGVATTATTYTVAGYSSESDDIIGLGLQASATNASYSGLLANTNTGGYAALTGATPAIGVLSNYVHAGFGFFSGNGFTTTAPLLPFDFCIDFVRLYTGNLQGVWIGNL